MTRPPATKAGTSPWYAVIVTERGVPTAQVLTAAEWQADQSPGPYAPNYKLIGGYPDKLQAQAAANKFNALPEAQQLARAGVTTGSLPRLPNPVSGLAAIGDFLGRLSQASTWVRVTEALIGLGLIIVGVAKLAAGTPVGNAALTAGKAAAIL